MLRSAEVLDCSYAVFIFFDVQFLSLNKVVCLNRKHAENGGYGQQDGLT